MAWAEGDWSFSSNAFVDVFQRTIWLSQFPKRRCAVVVCIGVVGVQPNGLGKILDGRHLLLEMDVGQPSVVVGFGVGGVQPYHLIEVTDRGYGFHQLAIDDAPLIEGLGVGGIVLDDGRQLAHGPLETINLRNAVIVGLGVLHEKRLGPIDGESRGAGI